MIPTRCLRISLLLLPLLCLTGPECWSAGVRAASVNIDPDDSIPDASEAADAALEVVVRAADVRELGSKDPGAHVTALSQL